MRPIRAVAESHARRARWSPRWMAETASTMVSELIRSTNDEIDVNARS